MTFGDSVAVCFREYSKFSGRASKSEYWWFQLALVLIYSFVPLLFALLGFLLGLAKSGSAAIGWAVIALYAGYGMCLVFLIFPTLAVTVRRLHDSGHSGWWYFISLIPGIGAIWLLVLMFLPSQEENKYGYPVY